MACLCDHTMQNIVSQIFWCPRCGTIKINGIYDAPKVIVRLGKISLTENQRIAGIEECLPRSGRPGSSVQFNPIRVEDVPYWKGKL